MSVRITSPSWKLNLAANAKIVLLKFGDCADDEGRNSWPSVETVAGEAGVLPATVKRLVRAFKADGVLVLEAEAFGRGNPNRYRLDVARAAELYGNRSRNDVDRPFAKPGEATAEREKGVTVTPIGAKKGITVTPFQQDGAPERGSSSDPQTVKEKTKPP